MPVEVVAKGANLVNIVVKVSKDVAVTAMVVKASKDLVASAVVAVVVTVVVAVARLLVSRTLTLPSTASERVGAERVSYMRRTISAE